MWKKKTAGYDLVLDFVMSSILLYVIPSDSILRWLFFHVLFLSFRYTPIVLTQNSNTNNY